VGRKFWAGMMDWINTTLTDMKYISPGDTDLFTLVDTEQEVVDYIEQFYNRAFHRPNF
jgi:hypothetical protein